MTAAPRTPYSTSCKVNRLFPRNVPIADVFLSWIQMRLPSVINAASVPRSILAIKRNVPKLFLRLYCSALKELASMYATHARAKMFRIAAAIVRGQMGDRKLSKAIAMRRIRIVDDAEASNDAAPQIVKTRRVILCRFLWLK